jgi:hypothetical protein
MRDRRKTVKLSMQLEPGVAPPSDQEVHEYQAKQLQHAAEMQERDARVAAERRVTTTRSSGACSFLQLQRPNPSGSAKLDTSAHDGQPETPSTEAAPEGHCKAPPQANQGPSENVLRLLHCKDVSNILAKRACSLKRFINAASTVIIRCWLETFTLIVSCCMKCSSLPFAAWKLLDLLQEPGSETSSLPASTAVKVGLGQAKGEGRGRYSETASSGQNGHASWC